MLAIPPKRFERNLVTFLTDDEVDALLAACDRSTWTGRRDHAMIVLAVQTGLRISELTGLTCADVVLGAGAHVRCLGKGRKERRTPLVPHDRRRPARLAGRTTAAARPSRCSRPSPASRSAATPSSTASRQHVRDAGQACPSIRTKKVTAHTLRHTAAMRLLLSGVDVTVIALWLGHEQVSTTNIYLHADMSQKERAIAAHHPAEHDTRPLSRPRPAPRLPRGPLIMPTPVARSPPLTSGFSPRSA